MLSSLRAEGFKMFLRNGAGGGEGGRHTTIQRHVPDDLILLPVW